MATKTIDERRSDCDNIRLSLESLNLLQTFEAKNKTECCMKTFINYAIKQTWFLSAAQDTYKVTLRPEQGVKSTVVKMLMA